MSLSFHDIRKNSNLIGIIKTWIRRQNFVKESRPEKSRMIISIQAALRAHPKLAYPCKLKKNIQNTQYFQSWPIINCTSCTITHLYIYIILLL